MKRMVYPFSSLGGRIHRAGFGLIVLGLALPLAAWGQSYQVQGNYNPATLPPAYQQQGVPPAGAGIPMSYAPQGYAPAPPSYQQPTAYYPPPPAPKPKSTPKPVTYAPAPPSTLLPQAYAQQGGTYAQPQPYPGHYAAPKPVYNYPQAPAPKKPVSSTPSTASEIASLKSKNQEQDRRLSALEGRTSSRPGGSSSASSSTRYTKHTVRRGESLWGIAERYGVSETAIKSANRRSSDIVIEGETLLIPTAGGGGSYVPSQPSGGGGSSGSTHIVQNGESLSTIAAAYRVSTRSLQEANGISNPNLIGAGQRLVIPGAGGGAPVSYTKKKTTPRYVTKSAPKAKEPLSYSDVVPPAAGEGLGSVAKVSGPRGVTSYRVEAGDSIESVARTFTTTPGEIQRINKLSSQRLPAVGEEIIVPLPGSVAM